MKPSGGCADCRVVLQCVVHRLQGGLQESIVLLTLCGGRQLASGPLRRRAGRGRRGTTDTFWIAYQFPVRPGVRVNAFDGNVNISRGRNSDGIEWLTNDCAAAGRTVSPDEEIGRAHREEPYPQSRSGIFGFTIGRSTGSASPVPRKASRCSPCWSMRLRNELPSAFVMTLGLHPEPGGRRACCTSLELLPRRRSGKMRCSGSDRG